LGQGERVTILGRGPAPDWVAFRGTYIDSSGPVPALPSQDLVISTFWTTIEPAFSLGLGPVAHFCQGYEGSHSHYLEQRSQIEAAYERPGAALTVTPYLGELLRTKFGKPSRVVPPTRDPRFRPRPRRRPRRRPWVAVPGVFRAAVKGVPTALEAIAILRRRGIECRVLRFSTEPLTDDERAVLDPDRYLAGVHPEVVARELRDCDLLLLPSQPEEGFGLPLLEAMASKVPAIASKIPSTVFMADGAVPLMPVGDAGAFARAALELLTDHGAWRRARRSGYRAVGRFEPETVAVALAEAVRWAASATKGEASGA
ncbi:MAG: glycosyltransferase, partial [Thermoanaerobaculia bacterium]